MTVLTRNKRFGAITGFAGPNAEPMIALAGPSHTVLHAAVVGSQLSFLGESADLGGVVLAGDNTSGTTTHVLTSSGLVLVSAANAPVVTASAAFDPGDGRWLARVGNFVVTPLAFGGLQVVRHNTLARVTALPNLLADSRFAAANVDLGHIWIVDGRTATIGTVKIDETSGALEYIGKTAAPNCREIVKVVLDADAGNLFVVCRRRIVRFTVPLTDVEDPRPTFAQDYGVARSDYTDFVVVASGRYWIGQDAPSTATPLPFFYGPLLGIWAPDLGTDGELVVAAPKSALWTVNNIIPYYTDDSIEDTTTTTPEPPPVITPPAPVISSALTASITEGNAFSYTITATGSGPITYGVTSPPAWLTSINPLTGAISGTAPTPSTVNITITATNSGGTDTETLVLTVNQALGDLTGISADGDIYASYIDTSSNIAYIGGGFSQVTDSSGTYTRNRVAAIDLSTGLVTAWNPNCNQTIKKLHKCDGFIYVVGVGSALRFNGVLSPYIGRVSLSSGALDTGWAPVFNGVIRTVASSGSDMYIGGNFTELNGSPQLGIAKFSSGAATSWKADNTDNLLPLPTPGSYPFTGRNGVGDPQVWSLVIGGAGVMAFGAFAMAKDDGGRWCRNVGSFDANDGLAVAMDYGASGAQFLIADAVAHGNGGYLIPCGQGPQSFAYQPHVTGTPPPAIDRKVALCSAGGLPSGFNPNIAAADDQALYSGAVLPDGSMFIGGLYSDVGGNTDLRGVTKFTSGGSVDSAFSFYTRFVIMSGTPPSVYRVELAPSLNLLLVAGQFGGDPDTYDGDLVHSIVFVNHTTGARL